MYRRLYRKTIVTVADLMLLRSFGFLSHLLTYFHLLFSPIKHDADSCAKNSFRILVQLSEQHGHEKLERLGTGQLKAQRRRRRSKSLGLGLRNQTA